MIDGEYDNSVHNPPAHEKDPTINNGIIERTGNDRTNDGDR
jgi:hypothetical protein